MSGIQYLGLDSQNLIFFVTYELAQQASMLHNAQHLILFVAYERAQQARVLHYTRPERLAIDNHTNLLVQFIS